MPNLCGIGEFYNMQRQRIYTENMRNLAISLSIILNQITFAAQAIVMNSKIN